MKNCETFVANIYVGLKHGYFGNITSVDTVRNWIQDFCNEVKLGVTLTETQFIYVDGREPGVIVGLINYPRFPKTILEIKATAMEMGEGLMKLCHQERISIVFSDETIMLES